MGRRGRPPYPDILTPREWEVLDLLRQGLTNEEIAERLGVSFAGAKYHVSEILSKLGVSSREEAARWSADGGGERPRWAAARALVPASLAARAVALGMALVVAAGVALLVWGLVRTDGDGPGTVPVNLVELLRRSDEAMNSTGTYRFRYEEVAFDGDEAGGILGDHRGAAVLPDKLCTYDSDPDGIFASEHIRIGSQEWIRQRSTTWAIVDESYPTPDVGFAHAEGGLLESGWLAGGTSPSEVRLAGQEEVGARPAWILEYQYRRPSIEGPFDEFAKLWIDQGTYRVLKKELRDNDPFGVRSLRRWTYSDFGSPNRIAPPQAGYVLRNGNAAPLDETDLPPRGTPFFLATEATPTPTC